MTTGTHGEDGRIRITRTATGTSARERLLRDVRAGLTASPKSLPPKYFYDARGSELFEEITRLSEYYLTRAETEILEARADEIMAAFRPAELLEIGSGSSRKTRLLLEAMHRVGGRRYVPFDVSEDALRGAIEVLAKDYSWLEIHGIVGDFELPLQPPPRSGRRLVAFLGSTIGNLVGEERAGLLSRVAELLDLEGDAFLLGIDLVKGADVLEAAYDDSAGVTAQFNKNVLHVINRELGGNLPLDAFEHHAFWDAPNRRIDMRLRATRDVAATIDALGLEVRFVPGEELHTELSCKFTREMVEQELGAAGMRLERWFMDAGESFALALAVRG